jgi:hypothetical protein
MDNIDLFKITIDEDYTSEDAGISQIAFVKNPAIMVKGLAFSAAEVAEHKLTFKDEVKMRIAAPVMIPMNIYRNDEEGEYYVQFTVEEIENIYVKFMQGLNNQALFNLEHTSKEVPSFILESWLVGKDPLRDRSYSEFGIELPRGSLFMVAQITDRAYYNKLIENDQVGFSIEGLFGLKFSQTKKQNPMKNQKFAKAKRYKAQRFEDAELVDSEVTLVVEDLTPGAEALVIDEELNIIEDFTGELMVEDQTVVLESGVITEVTAEEEFTEEETEKEEEVVATEEVKEEKEAFITDEEKTAIVSEVMQILDPKFEAIYEMIAEIKATMPAVSEEETIEVEEKFSLHQKFNEVINFLNK